MKKGKMLQLCRTVIHNSALRRCKKRLVSAPTPHPPPELRGFGVRNFSHSELDSRSPWRTQTVSVCLRSSAKNYRNQFVLKDFKLFEEVQCEHTGKRSAEKRPTHKTHFFETKFSFNKVFFHNKRNVKTIAGI